MAEIDQKLMEIASKESKMSLDELKKNKTAVDAEKKKPKPIPIANASKWLDKIKRSEKVRKPFKEDAERYMRYYQGDYSLRMNKKRNFEKMAVNFIYSHIEIITPAIFSGFPFIRIRPKPKANESLAEAEPRARNMELVINYWFKELAVDDELRDAFLDSFFGHTCVELGWETEVEEREEQFTREDGEMGTKTTTVVIKDRPFITRRDPWTVYFDPDARRRKDSRWIGIDDVMAYNDFLASPKFTEKAKQKVKPQTYPVDMEEKEYGSRDSETRSEKEWVKVTHIWDKDTRRIFSVTQGYKGFLNSDDDQGEPWPYEIDYKSDPFPFSILDAKRDRMTPYTWSEFRAYEAQMIEMNRIRSAIQIHTRRTLPKYIYTEAFGDRHQAAKVVNARSDEAIKVNNLDAFRPLEDAKIPADLYQFNTMSKEDMLNVSGLFEYQNQSIADTATEASLIEGRSQVRKSARSHHWEQYVVEIAGKLGQLCQQNMSQEIAVQIAGPNGTEWLNVSKEEIQGEFYFDIEPGIMEYKNEALRKQQLLKFAEITNGDPNVNRRNLVGKIAKELDMVPEDVMVAQDQIPPPPPPEPTISFKDIDVEKITDSVVMNALVLAACKQAGVDLPPQVMAHLGQVPAPQGPNPGALEGPIGPAPSMNMSGKNMADNGLNPNGNPGLPPVEGNMQELASTSGMV